jgi:hypothetical protein
VVLASDNLTYLPTPQLTTREQPFHIKHLPASYYSRPYNRLELPNSMKVHNVFHVSLLDRYAEPVPGQQPSEPQPAISAEDSDEEEWEVERILDSRKRYRKLSYLVQWAGYNYVRTSWEPAENLKNAAELLEEFHRENPAKPKA